MVRRINLGQPSVRRVADDYLFSSDALSMSKFDMTHDSRLEMFFLQNSFFFLFLYSSLLFSLQPVVYICLQMI